MSVARFIADQRTLYHVPGRIRLAETAPIW